MYLKLDQMMFRRYKTRYILSSGGQTDEVNGGGIAIWMKNSELFVDIRTTNPPRAWTTKYQHPLSWSPRWSQVAIRWRKGGQLDIFWETHRGIATSSRSFTPKYGLAPRNMMIGRANHVDTHDFYGTCTIPLFDGHNYRT